LLPYSYSYKSAGCSKGFPKFNVPIKRGVPKTLNITITDETFGKVKRSYTITLPENYNQTKPSPLSVFFHGQGAGYPYSDQDVVGSKKGFIIVQPLGLSDSDSKTIAWNTGIYDNGIKAADKTCFKDTSIGECYYSCQQKNLCSVCGWSTCYDDAFFIKKLIQRLKNKFCINTNRVYASGESNGGMMVWYLLGRYPNMFNAASPVYGNSLVNETKISEKFKSIDLLLLYDRTDLTVPQDGVSEDGWIYDSMNTILEQIAREQECAKEMGLRGYKTPYDGGK